MQSYRHILILFNKTLYGNRYKNRETTQRCICHYYLLSQTTRLKKAIIKEVVLFSAASGNLNEGPPTLHYLRRHKFAIKALLFSIEFFIVYSDLQLNKAHIIYYCVYTTTLVRRKRYNVTLYVYIYIICLVNTSKTLFEKQTEHNNESVF
jgi:IS4 transposase